MTYRIPEQNMDELRAKLEKLNKRAAKLGVAPVSYTEVSTEVVADPRTHAVSVYHIIEIQGEAPKLAGWSFVATLEHDEGTVIIRRIPTFEDEVDLTSYRDASPEDCDHCNQRRRRNDTYVVAHEDGTLKQVGSSCLKDFLGHANPEQIARWLEMVADFVDEAEGGFSSGGHIENRFASGAVLADTARMIREHGWLSKGAAAQRYDDEQATAVLVSHNIFDRANNRHHKGQPMWVDPEAQDIELAEKALAWVRSLTEADLANDYLYNLYTVLSKDSIRDRQFGLACSAVAAYERHIEREIKRREAAKGKVHAHIGTVGEKIEVQGTLSKITWMEDYYNGGSKPLYVFSTEQGEVKWFASRDMGLTIEVCYDVKGTVKKHEDHEQYGMSTVVTRCKVQEA